MVQRGISVDLASWFHQTCVNWARDELILACDLVRQNDWKGMGAITTSACKICQNCFSGCPSTRWELGGS
jgi:hypothetical protein